MAYREIPAHLECPCAKLKDPPPPTKLEMRALPLETEPKPTNVCTECGYARSGDIPESCWNQNAKLVLDEKYKCHYCGSPIFSDEVAVWCIHSTMEGGTCEYRLMSG